MADIDVRDGKVGKTKTHSRPVVFYLVALVLVILIPAFAVTLVLLNRTNDAQQDVLKALTNTTVQAIGHSVDREIAGMATTLRVLSTSGFLRAGDLSEFSNRSVQALAGTGTYLIAADGENQQLFNTRVPFGSPLGPTSDAETAARALERNVTTVSGLFYGQTAQEYVFNVWLPLQDPGPVRLLALTQNARNLIPALQSRQMPMGWNAALIDSDNFVIAATADANLGIGETLPLRPGGGMPNNDWEEDVLEDQNVVTSEWRSGLTGWRVVAWAPAAQVHRPLQDSLLQLAAWGLMTAIAACAVSFLIAQRIGRSVKGLSDDAARMGRGEAVYPRSYPVAEIAGVSRALAAAFHQMHMGERDISILMSELAHRSKNQMAVIAAMAKQTARGATDLPSYVQALERRIMGLARSTDLLLAHGRAGVMLEELIEEQLAPFRPPGERAHIEGPALRINPQGAQILGMALHELSTNATRYGAFADPDGTLSLTWTVNEDSLQMRWREQLGSKLLDSDRSGFGTIVLRTMVVGALNAQVDRIAHEDGVEWVFNIPLASLDPAFAAPRPDEAAPNQ